MTIIINIMTIIIIFIIMTTIKRSTHQCESFWTQADQFAEGGTWSDHIHLFPRSCSWLLWFGTSWSFQKLVLGCQSPLMNATLTMTIWWCWKYKPPKRTYSATVPCTPIYASIIRFSDWDVGLNMRWKIAAFLWVLNRYSGLRQENSWLEFPRYIFTITSLLQPQDRLCLI